VEVRIHPHAEARLAERGVTRDEVVSAVASGERFPAKFHRTGFRRDFAFNGYWRGKTYATKQVEAYAAEEGGAWLVITVIARYF
jgi:hypothetical protein